MPYSFDLLDQQKKKQQNGQDPNAPAMTGGGLSFGGGAGGASPQPTQPQQQQGTQKQGSGFVTLNKYMDANKGSGFGGQFTGKVENQVNQGKQSLAQGAQDFTNASNQGSFTDNSAAKGIIDNAGDGLSQDDVSTVKNTANAKYQGPENFLGTAAGQQAQSNVQKASSQANALQSEGGRFSLLDQYYGRPTYSSGQKSLDNLLVQNDNRTAARSQSLGNQAKGLSSQAADQNMQLDNFAAGNKAKTADTAKQTQEYLKSAQTGFTDDLNKRYGDYQVQNDAYNNTLSGAAGADQVGFNSGETTYGIKASDYLRHSPKASLGQFASDKDYGRYLALQQLSGEDPTILSAADRANAGSSGNMGKDYIDGSALHEAVGQRAKAFSNEAFAEDSPLSKLANELGPDWVNTAKNLSPDQLLNFIKNTEKPRVYNSVGGSAYVGNSQNYDPAIEYVNGLIGKYGADKRAGSSGSVGGSIFNFGGMAR